jgi:hypothetical protein
MHIVQPDIGPKAIQPSQGLDVRPKAIQPSQGLDVGPKAIHIGDWRKAKTTNSFSHQQLYLDQHVLLKKQNGDELWVQITSFGGGDDFYAINALVVGLRQRRFSKSSPRIFLGHPVRFSREHIFQIA